MGSLPAQPCKRSVKSAQEILAYILCVQELLIQSSSFGLCQIACVFKAGNLKAVAGFKKETELYPYKCRSKSSTSSTFSVNPFPSKGFPIDE